jgi:hypothetical protein
MMTLGLIRLEKVKRKLAVILTVVDFIGSALVGILLTGDWINDNKIKKRKPIFKIISP